MILLSGMILVFGLAMASISVYTFMLNLFTWTVVTYFASCVLITFSCQLFLTRSFKKISWSFYSFLGLVCFFIPLFGIIITLSIVGFMSVFYTKTHPFADRVDETINLDEILPFSASYGAGGVPLHLLRENASTAERSKALYTLRKTSLSNINSLIYKLLPDSSDEMRLLAFNILEGQEDSITKRIHSIVSMLENDSLSNQKMATCQKDLAMLYWEFIYNHLISPELEELILDKAISYALSALEVLTTDATLWVLLGKIYKYAQQYQLAESAFQKAISFHISPAQVLPYMAEIKYKTHDYQAIKQYLNLSDTLLDIPQIASVKIFWDKN